jgi:hypothetical protein
VGRGEVFGRMRLIRVSMERQATRSGVQWAPTWSARTGGAEAVRAGVLRWVAERLRMVNVSTGATRGGDDESEFLWRGGW